MAGSKENIVLSATADLTEATKQTDKFTGSWSKSMRKIGNETEKSFKDMGKGLLAYSARRANNEKKYTPLLKKTLDLQTKLGKAFLNDLRTQKRLLNVKKAEALFDKAAGANTEKVEAEIKVTEDLIDARKKLYSQQSNALKDQLVEVKSHLVLDAGDSIKEWAEAAKESAESVSAPFKALVNRDIPGAFQDGASLVGGVFKGVGKKASGWGDSLGKRAAALLEKSRALKATGKGGRMEGAKSAAMGMAGKAMSGAGNGMDAIAKKWGPLLNLLSGAVAGLIQMFIDAQGDAKAFNKELIATAGTGDYLAKSFGNATAASASLGADLKTVRDAANDFSSNMKWGINPEDHKAVLTSLTAEGVTLDRLMTDYKDLAATSDAYSKSIGSVTQMAIAYSRTMGVSVQEVTSLQGELMSEMGMSVTEVQKQFQFMTKEALGAGVATNKFFNIMRGFTADMSLFNNRMEDAVHLMATMMKTMSPKNAKEFFQTISSHYKGMGLIDRTKAVLLAGGDKKSGTDTGSMLQKGLDERLKSLGEDLKTTLGPDSQTELIEAVKGGPEAAAQFMAKHQDKLNAEQKDAILSASRMQGKLSSGGLVDVASALKDASLMEVIKHLDKISQTMFKQPMDKLSGVNRIAFENLTGVNDEQIDQRAKMKASIDQLKADMVYNLKAGNKLTEPQLAQLQKLGIDVNDANAADKLAKKDADAIFNSMSMDQKKNLDDVKKTTDYAAQTSEHTQSMRDKLDILIKWFMGQFYNVIMNIYEMLAKSTIFGGAAAKSQLELIKAVNNAKDPALTQAMTDAAGDSRKMVGLFIASKSYETKLKEMMGQRQGGSREAFLDSASVDELRDTLKDAGVDVAKQKSATVDANGFAIASFGDARSGKEDKGALLEAIKNLDQAKQDKILEKLAWHLDPVKVATAFAGAAKEEAPKPGAPGAPVAAPGAPVPSAQANAAAKSAEPGAAAAPGAPVPAASAAPAAPAKSIVPDVQAMQAKAFAGAGIGGDDMTKILDSQKGTLDTIYHALRVRGIKLDKVVWGDAYKKTTMEAVYDASSKAILEYWLYSQLGIDKVAEAQKNGMSMSDINSKLVTGLGKGLKPGDALQPAKDVEAPANASGGVVAAIQGGMAQIQPAPGEGLASVGRGEQIVPAGGGRGGQKVVIEFRGDAGKLFDAKVDEGYARNRGREKF